MKHTKTPVKDAINAYDDLVSQRVAKMDIEALKKAIAEYLETCDDEAEEEEYTTMWHYAQRQLSLFVKWLEENGRESALALALAKGEQ